MAKESGGPEKHVLGGRTFLTIEESTIAQDFHFMTLVKRAGIDEIILHPEETPEAFARRLLEATIESGTILDLLGCLLVPEALAPKGRDPGESWTGEIGEDTARYLGQLKTPEDKAKVRALVLSLLISFFDNGIVSLWSSKTSSDEAIPNAATTAPIADGTAPGPTSLKSSLKAIMTGPSGSSRGRCGQHSASIAGD